MRYLEAIHHQSQTFLCVTLLKKLKKKKFKKKAIQITLKPKAVNLPQVHLESLQSLLLPLG